MLKTITIWLLTLGVTTNIALAHPLDETTTKLVFENNIVTAQTFFSWPQAAQIMGIEFIPTNEQQFIQSTNAFTTLFKQDFKIENCVLADVTPIWQGQEKILFGDGIQVDHSYKCKNNTKQLLIENKLFIKQYSTQTNITSLYDTSGSILSSKKLYADSDNVTFELNNYSNSSESIPTNLFEKISTLLTQKINSSLPWALVLTFLLGMLHTLEAGHSKTILASYMLDKKVSIKNGTLYALIFTLTHVSDILIIGFLLMVTNSYTDIYSKIPYLQTGSTYALLIISTYLVIKNLREVLKHKQGHKHHHHHEHEDIKTPSIKKQIALGFVTGLAPCLIGWSIFMIAISTKKIWTVFPLIFSFGFGIFVALMLIVLLSSRIRNKLYKKSNWLSEYSPILSAIFLLIFSIVLLVG